MLVLGESGGGKTHLMHAFRNQVHGQHLGYCGYLQLTTGLDDYPRYMLSNLIESLDQPYNEFDSETSSLMHLSNALAESSPVLRAERDSLRNDEFDRDALGDLVAQIADNVIADERYSSLDLQLIRVLIYLQRYEPSLKSRALSWLRCEDLSSRDRNQLGGVPRRDDPEKMLADLGQIMSQLQGLSLVVCIDQLEELHNMEDTGQRFRRAMQTVCSLAERVPSSIFVVSCLEDFYTDLSKHLTRSATDRIEKADPVPVTLEAHRTLSETQALVARRLRFLYQESDVDFDESEPTYPIPAAAIEALANQRSRDILLWCGEYRRRCVAAGKIVDANPSDDASRDRASQNGLAEVSVDSNPISEPVSTLSNVAKTEPTAVEPAPPAVVDVIELEQLWNEFRVNRQDRIPDSNNELVQLLSWSIRQCSHEITTGHKFATDVDDWTVAVEIEAADSSVEILLVGLCNQVPQGGCLGRRITKLEELAGEHRIVVARSTAYPKSAKSKIVVQLGKLIARGGRKTVVEDSDWRMMSAFHAFSNEHSNRPGFAIWRQSECPLSRLKSMRMTLDLDNLKPISENAQGSTKTDDWGTSLDAIAAEVEVELNAIAPVTSDSTTTSSAPRSDALNAVNELEIGVVARLREEPVTIAPNALKTHAAFLGGSGSGKTTLALNIVEQLLIRKVPVILIDRKGDLGGYARSEFWSQSLPQARNSVREELRKKVAVQIYTPGHPDGKPLSIPMIPEGLHEQASFEQRSLAQHASNALGSMMSMKRSGADGPRLAVLDQAIRLVAEVTEGAATLSDLIEFIDGPDPALSNALGRLDAKHLKKLVDNLVTLRLTRGHLLEKSGEPLNIDALVQPQDGRVPLSIVNTKFLGDNAGIEFWVAQFLMTLSRWTSQHPSEDLQLAVMFDEADMYLPAQRQPATKPLMEDLLKRARSAGVSVFLATQSPGDLDYKCRDKIRTWFVGRVKEKTALDKLKPMLSECKVDISAKLPVQQTGEFHLLQDGQVTPFRAHQSLLKTEQLSEQETLKLARG